ncbi:MAG: peptidase M61, partial [Pedobacter sp.]
MIKTSLIALLILLSTGMVVQSKIKIGYQVSFIEPQAHYAEVEMNVSGISKKYVDLKMPVWTPGSYLVREFAKSVEGFSAEGSGKALKFEKITKNTWRVYTEKAK